VFPTITETWWSELTDKGEFSMQPSFDAEQDDLLCRAGQGDQTALDRLLTFYRPLLRRMISIHMDPRLAGRFDPSDVVQDTLWDVERKLAEYVRTRPLPLYPWLRRLAWEQLILYHRRHISVQSRSVEREQLDAFDLPDHSAMQLAERLAGNVSSPSQLLSRRELRERVQAALARLSHTDRDVLVLRFLELLSLHDAAAVLKVSEAAVNMRQLRALRHLQRLLAEQGYPDDKSSQ